MDLIYNVFLCSIEFFAQLSMSIHLHDLLQEPGLLGITLS